LFLHFYFSQSIAIPTPIKIYTIEKRKGKEKANVIIYLENLLQGFSSKYKEICFKLYKLSFKRKKPFSVVL